MSIQEILRKIKFLRPKETYKFNESGEVEPLSWLRRFFLALVIVLVAGASFGLGLLYQIGKRGSVQIYYENLDKPEAQMTNDKLGISHSALDIPSQAVTASAKGSKYYFSWCGNSISDKNKVTFASAAAAEAAGYTLASTCSPR